MTDLGKLSVAPLNRDAAVIYQPARPDQAETAAALFWSSGYEIFDFNYLGQEPFSRMISDSWGRDDAIFSHKHTHAAYIDDQLVGIEMGFTNESLPERVPGHIMAKSAAMTDEENQISDERWPQIAPLVPSPPEATYYVSNLAVLPEAQGRKIGLRLLTAAFTRAKKDGFEWVMLDVCHRKPAVRFYEQLGMIRLVETRLPQLEEPYDVPMHIRMGIELKNWTSISF